MSKSNEPKLPLAKKDSYNYEEWTIETIHSHIMGSKCENSNECTINTKKDDLCNVCYYEKELKLSSLPDMVFANNKLIFQYSNGGCIEFNALDALKGIGKTAKVEVAHAKVWQDARSDCKYAKRIVKDYDWTYSTSYSGTIKGPLKVEPTSERINLEKLKVQEKILFYKEIYLYEDELDDNGCTRCTVKVVDVATYKNPDIIWQHLPIIEERIDMISPA